MIEVVSKALETHELIKVRLHQPSNKKAMARELAELSSSELCGRVGHTVILYRRREEDPTLELPERPAAHSET